MEFDRSFGPTSPQLFDFTLTFEYAIFGILSSAVFIAVSPFYIRQYKNLPQVIVSSPLLWTKLCSAIALTGLTATNIALANISLRQYSLLAVPSTVLACAASLLVGLFLFVEHKHSTQLSGFLSVWLTIGILMDAATARSYFLRSMQLDLGATAAAVAAVKLVLVILQEVPKTQYVKDKNTGKPIGQEARSGFWNRTFYVWINKTLFAGFRTIISINDLDAIDDIFNSSALIQRFNRAWSSTDKSGSHPLTYACLRATLWTLLAIILPRLCFTFFMFVQPFFFKAVLAEIANDASKAIQAALIGAGILVYFGVAISRSVYTQINYRVVTMVRGMLVAAIFQKVLSLPFSQAEAEAAVTLMTTDIEGIADGIPTIHETWINILELGFAIYFLYSFVGPAAFFVFIPTMASVVISRYLSQRVPVARKVRNERIEERVARTSEMLSQIKAIKMTSLDKVSSKQLRDLRAVEIKYSIKTRVLSIFVNATSILCATLTPVLVIAGALFWTTFNGVLTPAGAFGTLAIIYLSVGPLHQLLGAYSDLLSALACADRIQVFLLLNSTQEFSLEDSNLDHTNSEATEEEKDYVASFDNAMIALQSDPEKVILHEVSLKIQKSEIIVIHGSVGCGKTTFLQSIIGSAQLASGDVDVLKGSKANCSQNPWLRNVSIRENILGFNEHDSEWYGTVLDTCMLQPDLELLSNHDLFIVGSNGSNLSGGQKQRVALARALYSRSPVLILDDTFSALDKATRRGICSRLFGDDGLVQRQNRTVVMTTSSARLSEYADRSFFIDSDGKVSVRTDLEIAVAGDYDLFKVYTDSILSEHEMRRGGTSANICEAQDQATENPAERSWLENEKQKGDIQNYVIFIQAIGWTKFTIWVILTVALSIMEQFPDVYMRIWVDTAPDNTLYFIGYGMISAVASMLCILMLGFWYTKAVPTSLERLHGQLLDTVMNSTLSFLTKTGHGYLLNFFSQDMTLVSQELPLVFMRLFYLFTTMLVCLIIILSGTKYSAVLFPLLMAALYGIQHFYLRTSRQIRHLDLESKTPLYTQLSETITGIEHIRAFGWEAKTLEKSLHLLDVSQIPFYHMNAIQRWLALVMDLIIVALGSFVLPVAFTIHSSATLGGIALSLVGLLQFGDLLTLVVRDWTSLETALSALGRLRHFFASTPQESDTDVTVSPEWPQLGHVVMKHVNAQYEQLPGIPPVLSDINIDIAGGTKVGVIGRTGCGKSSLLLSLLNLLPYDGSISIDGIDISKIPRDILRSRIITISQDQVEVTNSTAQLNICPWTVDMSEEEASPLLAKAEELLERFGLWSIIDAEGGWSAKMAALGLSHGQKHMIGIARSVLKQQSVKSKILLVDEATSNLDDASEQLVYKTIGEYFDGCTIITVSHRPAMLANSDITLRMSAGSIAESADHRKGEKLQADSDVVASSSSFNSDRSSYTGSSQERRPDNWPLLLQSTIYRYNPDSDSQVESVDSVEGFEA